jgi:hypothetical protein
MKSDLLKIFRNLQGNWLINRKINDVKKGKIEFAEGNAIFHPNLNEKGEISVLNYEERGILKLSETGKKLKFKRNYIYKYKNEAIEIYLDDGLTKGKLFQKLLKKGDKSQCKFDGTEHICKLDKHNGEYYFKSMEEFETYFTIESENKKIEIKTSFKKQDI